MNISWCRQILRDLHAVGVRDFVYCAGARNAPLVTVLSKTSGFETHSFFDERAAGFYALGVARRTGQPVAICTTSGTAVAELLPAVIEAFHTGVPLILITADRPRRLRGTGAPQAIDQTGLFGKFVAFELDLDDGANISFASWNRRAPLHFNICLDEPLLDETLTALDIAPAPARPSFAGQSTFEITAGLDWAELRLTKFLRGDSSLVIVVGTLESSMEREAVVDFLLRTKRPVYLEATSGLRDRDELSDLALRSGDQVLAWGLRTGAIDKILRIGGVPTVRIWRDLDEPGSRTEVLSLTALPFAGLSRGELICTEIAPVLAAMNEQNPSSRSLPLFTKDREAQARLLELLIEEPNSEPAMVRAYSRLIPDRSLVYLGNSLPIREWDLAADWHRGHFAVEANRGVNGIDGQVATFIGLSRAEIENWALIGDLTALYDLSGPWALNCRREDLRVRLGVMNNGGGRIFSRLFKNPAFENRHGLEFSHWAAMWGFSYEKWSQVPETFAGNDRVLIEMTPDEESTARFWRGYDELWK